MAGPLALEQVAVRLADEGVPLRAIARSLDTPTHQLRDDLREACESGRLLELPKEDWPPGFPRDQRALQLSRMVTKDPAKVHLAIQQVFHLTVTEATLLMQLLQSSDLHRDRVELSSNNLDVHICSIRQRLAPFGVLIQTLWGYGYQLAGDHRQKLMKLILKKTGVAA